MKHVKILQILLPKALQAGERTRNACSIFDQYDVTFSEHPDNFATRAHPML